MGGNTVSKEKPRDKLESKDWKYVEKQDPDKIKHLNKWIKKYNFDGRLNTQKIAALQDSIKNKTKQNQKRMKKEGYEDTRVWMRIAINREKGESKRKEEEEKASREREKQVLMHRKEDDETGRVKIRPVVEEAVEEGGEEEVGVEANSLYPNLRTCLPPQYEEAPRSTRSKGPPLSWSKKLGQALAPVPSAQKQPQMNPEIADQYPLIEVANPLVGEGQPPVILVYRTWTMEDVRKAIEGVTSYKEDATQFCQDMENLRRSYHLNGHEVQQIWMTALGPHWHHVRGGWNPVGTDGEVLDQASQELTNRVTALADRVTERFRRRANYTEIGRVKQKDDESFEDYKLRMIKTFRVHSGLQDDDNDAGPYRQQLKNALHAGSKDAIRCWVAKHYIGLATSNLEEYINHALHAEKVTQEKNKKKTAETFFQEAPEIHYQSNMGRGRGTARGRNQRGRGRGGRVGRGNYRYQNSLGCWCCGKDGHIARNCPEGTNHSA